MSFIHSQSHRRELVKDQELAAKDQELTVARDGEFASTIIVPRVHATVVVYRC